MTNTAQDASRYLTDFHVPISWHLSQEIVSVVLPPWRDQTYWIETADYPSRPVTFASSTLGREHTAPEKTQELRRNASSFSATWAESRLEENVGRKALLAEASIALDERLSTHPALRATT